jgi:hypothetical protein
MKYATTKITALFSRGVWILALVLAADVAIAQSLPPDVPATSQLVGTVQSSHFSGAVFDDGTGKQSFYRLHTTLPDGSEIVQIGKKSILVKQSDGEVYEMFTVGGKSHAPQSPPENVRPTPRENGRPPSSPPGSSIPGFQKFQDRRHGREG